MCGLSGIFDLTERRTIDSGLLAAINNTVAHRGPDDAGYHIEPGIGLGHRRLSIIDVAGGHQPVFNQDGSVAIVYNGEIYNYLALRDELREAGHTFLTNSDTEVVVHAWEQWGRACVERFNGMFAFAIWDRKRSTLFLARDRLGIKPLYYTLTPNQFVVFGSELKVLLKHPDTPRNLNPMAVEDFFTLGYVPDPKTIFRNVYKLPPGHTVEIRHRQSLPAPQRYWDVPFVAHAGGSADVEEEVVQRLREAVRLRLMSEVPLGAFLSGGVDSSAVVAMMAGLMGEPVNTCSISFGDPRYDEIAYANQVAERYGTAHHTGTVDPNDFSLLDALVDLYDEPFADSSAMPTYRVCELARRNVTVALSGDGGDESFAGYRRHRWHMHEEQIRSRLPAGLRHKVFGMLGRHYPKLDWAPRFVRGKSTFQALARDSVAAYLHSVSVTEDGLRGELFSAAMKRDLQGYRTLDTYQAHADAAPTDDPLSLIQYLDFKTYLPGDILTKVDRASMAHGLEVRVPILDHTFVEWVSGLPSSIKLHNGEGKHIFKSALRPHLSEEILYRPKMGFAVPITEWFRGPLRTRVRDAVLGETLQATGLFDHAAMTKLVDQHQSGRRNHAPVLWALLMFDGFCRRVAEV